MAIASKAAKLHSDKAETILIIDNRSTDFELPDLQAAAKRFDELREASPFKEVWFYTGYYSDLDGQNAEWSFSPVLLPDPTTERFRHSLEQNAMPPNQAGLVYSGFK